MSLYNMLFGMNEMSDFILATLGLSKSGVGRFRDCYIEKSEDRKYRIAVYTRNGGGNREHWDDDKEEGENCDCPGCIISHKLPYHDLYIMDKDDDFDSTYATIYFNLPPEYEKELIQWAIAEPKTASDKFLALIESMNNGEQTPLVKNALQVGNRILDDIIYKLEESKDE